MAATQEDITFMCIIESIHKTKSVSQKQFTKKKSEVLKGFKTELPSRYLIEGDIIFYNARKARATGKLTPGEKITDLVLTLGEALGDTRTFFVRYDEKKSVAGGGYGTGAGGKSHAGKPARAQGGVGMGGSLHKIGGARGGNGIGGDGRGEQFDGYGGDGFGGFANVTVPNMPVVAGTGVGGEAVDAEL